MLVLVLVLAWLVLVVVVVLLIVVRSSGESDRTSGLPPYIRSSLHCMTPPRLTTDEADPDHDSTHRSIKMDQSIICGAVSAMLSFQLPSPMASHLQKAPSFDIVDALDQRILILDGAMGTMVQQFKLKEDDYRGTYSPAIPRI